jgi:hypothetical protein
VAARNKLLEVLTGGDCRSIGKSNRVVALVLKQPKLLSELIRGMRCDDALVRMRVADAAEKVSLKNPDLLQPFKKELLKLLDEAVQQELRWHLAQMIPRLALKKNERLRAVSRFKEHLRDSSSIVKTSALQGLVDLISIDESFAPEVKDMLQRSVTTGTPAMKARARKLLRVIERSKTH